MVLETQLYTADELLRMPDDGWRYELVRGELRRMPPAGAEHGEVASDIGGPLRQYVKEHGLGKVFAAETGFLIATDPDTVRAPDAAFVRQDRVPAGGTPKGYWPGAPDLAVEVISPNDTYAEVEDKVGEWLAAGARLVLVLSPSRRTVSVFRSLSEITVLTENDILTGGDVIPGWAVPVRDLFG